jgi:hypothetical protein
LVAVECSSLAWPARPASNAVNQRSEAGELIRRQLDDCLGDLFDFHAAQYSTAGGLVEPRKGMGFRGDLEFRSPYQAP